ncbi:cysteine proteinase inhibitor 5-like [Silene latifolia]|uniref:cysteine proteinase inhibitor 5-like n=1 Tax=Silene latifolia TaxID=37657 RepID=UPI003D7897B1
MQGSATIVLVSLVLVFILVCVSNTDARVSKAATNDLSGGWAQTKDVTDLKIVEVAQFAVSEYDHTMSKSFKLVKVVKGEIQYQDGVKYHLYIIVETEGNNYDYGVFVQDDDSSRTLISFFPDN